MNQDDVYNVEFKDKGLKALIAAFAGNIPSCRVGILGTKANRKTGTDGGPTNAEIGAVHEYGAVLDNGTKLPARSFLRIPISEKLEKYLEKKGALNEDTIKATMQEKSLKPFFRKIGIVAVGIVGEAFATGGFGKWIPSIMKYKKVKQTLVETRQLQRSISSDVK